MINKYNNPRLHNTVLTGPGMTHPRNPHVVIGSDEQGFIQGDLMDANAILETIDQKIDVDNIINDEKLNTAPTPSDTTHLSNIILFFTAGSSPALTITSDSTIVWLKDFTIDVGVSYEINCLFNGTKWVIAQMSIS